MTETAVVGRVCKPHSEIALLHHRHYYHYESRDCNTHILSSCLSYGRSIAALCGRIKPVKDNKLDSKKMNSQSFWSWIIKSKYVLCILS